MQLINKFRHYCTASMLLIGLTLATGAIFKICAFAREAFIAAHFGLSTVTDAYFGLQQFPASMVSFMFGAFSLAFTPAFAEDERRSGSVQWLPGLLIQGTLIGGILSLAMIGCSSLLLRLIHTSSTAEVHSTLVLLSLCFIPIIWIGIWKSICTAHNRNLWAMSLTGLPYLLMTLALLAAFACGHLNNLSLPLSMTIGFALVGVYSFVRIVSTQGLHGARQAIFSIWTMPRFRSFLWQLGASATENAGFVANQVLLMYFLSALGTGVVSANNCAMRVGMLGYSLLSQPLSHLVQGRLCSATEKDRPALFRRWLLIYGGLQLLFAVAFFALRMPILKVVYLHGKFTGTELAQVADILPAWIAYCVVMSLSGLTANYLFSCSRGASFMRSRLAAYVAANLLRFVLMGGAGASALIWCSVATEIIALGWNLRGCFGKAEVVAKVPAAAMARAAV